MKLGLRISRGMQMFPCPALICFVQIGNHALVEGYVFTSWIGLLRFWLIVLKFVKNQQMRYDVARRSFDVAFNASCIAFIALKVSAFTATKTTRWTSCSLLLHRAIINSANAEDVFGLYKQLLHEHELNHRFNLQPHSVLNRKQMIHTSKVNSWLAVRRHYNHSFSQTNSH